MSLPPNVICPKPRRPVPLDTPQGASTPLVSTNQPNGTLSRTQSFLNLTSSSLKGIFTPRRYDFEQDNITSIEEPHAHAPRVPLLSPSSFDQPSSTPTQPPVAWGMRLVLLFGSGMGYGLLIKHLHDEPQLTHLQFKNLHQSDDWIYSIFWGLLSMLVGCLLPLLDSFFPFNQCIPIGQKIWNSHPTLKKEPGKKIRILDQDWTPAIRSIGAFVGIACAIRKLPWNSTLQASFALSMVNLALWYLIDRSRTGFLLSSVVGLAGTPLLLILNPELIPHPVLLTASKSMCTARDCDSSEFVDLNCSRREIPEASIWILSVLFCSCVCFGNVGRRLALGSG